jgi:protein-S-isoprenylcysteine O-methyltransferase Ste14
MLFILAAIAMILADRFLPRCNVIALPMNFFGVPLVIGGLGMAFYHARLFRKLGTNLTTFDEPGQLVTGGMYRVTRNPMYLGFVLALLGGAIWLGTLAPFGVVITFIIITDRWYIAFEERAMAAKFGAAYDDYRRRVRRWI